MRRQLERDLMILKEKLAAVEKKLQNSPGSRYLKDLKNSYMQAIRSAETTLQIIDDLDQTILNNVANFGSTQKVL